MAVNETILTGRKFRKLIDEVNKQWQRISFWTKASDVEFNDGSTAESKLGSFKGITTDTNVVNTGYAADMTVVKQLNSNLGGVIINTEGSGANIKYFAQLGADSASKKQLGDSISKITINYYCKAVAGAYESDTTLKNLTATYTLQPNGSWKGSGNLIWSLANPGAVARWYYVEVGITSVIVE